jgi:hypothetical protein
MIFVSLLILVVMVIGLVLISNFNDHDTERARRNVENHDAEAEVKRHLSQDVKRYRDEARKHSAPTPTVKAPDVLPTSSWFHEPIDQPRQEQKQEVYAPYVPTYYLDTAKKEQAEQLRKLAGLPPYDKGSQP